MHTLHELDATDFRYETAGQAVERNEILPPIGINARLGVVMGSGLEGLGAANLLLSCVIDFYDALSARKDDFFEYPDFYTFQTSNDPADYRMFDIYPDHKNVVVKPDAETLLRAINDRAISILLLPTRSPSKPDIEDITLRSAERRIEHSFRYSADGKLGDGGFVIETPRQPVEDWFETTANSLTASTTEEQWRPSRDNPQHISQSFQQISIEEALEQLPAVAE